MLGVWLYWLVGDDDDRFILGSEQEARGDSAHTAWEAATGHALAEPSFSLASDEFAPTGHSGRGERVWEGLVHTQKRVNG